MALTLTGTVSEFERERALESLLSELRDLDRHLTPRRQAGPGGCHSKDAGHFMTAGQVLLPLLAGLRLSAMLDLLQAWASRNAGKKLILELHGNRIELGACSNAQQDLALQQFFAACEGSHHERPSLGPAGRL